MRWVEINKSVPCDFEAIGPDERVGFTKAAAFQSPQADSKPYDELIRLELPDASALDWSELISLRRDSGFADLRDVVKNLVNENSNDIEATREAFRAKVEEANREVVARAKPNTVSENVGSGVAETIISLLPIIGTVVGVVQSVADGVEDFKIEKRLRWFFTLNEMNTISTNTKGENPGSEDSPI